MDTGINSLPCVGIFLANYSCYSGTEVLKYIVLIDS